MEETPVKTAIAKKPETKPAESETTEFFALLGKLGANSDPDPTDIHRFRRLIFKNPALLSRLQTMAQDLRFSLLQKITGGTTQARIMAEDDEFCKEMGYRYATPMERLLIDQILSTRIHLMHAEMVFNQKMTESLTFAASTYWQNFLSNAQRRHQRAIETLARVRRLARHGPLLQVNIDNRDQRAVRIQGELFPGEARPLESASKTDERQAD